jgi:ADP-heptose:LPS heptosyltransferase
LEDKGLHVAEMFQLVAAASSPQAAESGLTPNSFRRNILGRLVAEKAKTPTVVLYVDAPVNERVWPPERFAETADFAVEQLGAAIVVVSSNERSELAARVQRASRNPGSLAVLTGLSLPQLAGVIASAQLLVSNDTGPMHIGPVVGVRTLGLFSVGYPEHFRPLGPADRFLRANPIEGVSVRDVTRLMEEMWSTVDRGLPR